MIRRYTREAGVRNLERELAKIARKAVTKIVKKEVETVAVTRENLDDYLGVPKHRYGLAEEEDQVGVVTGLAWTSVGGGLKEKLLAALRGGIKTVLIPEDNAKDLPEIPDNVKEGLEIIVVKHVSEVLEHALIRKPEAIEWDAEAEEAAAAAKALAAGQGGAGAVAH